MRNLTDKEYEAKWDAETLAQAETIRADATRLANAKTAAQRMASEQEENARAMKKVAGKSTVKKESLFGYQPTPTTARPQHRSPVLNGTGPHNVFKRI